MTAPGRELDRNLGLDGVRAIAIGLVLMSHGRHCLAFLEVPHWRWWWLSVGGGLGVEIFFVLSGYLVGGIIVREVWGVPPQRRAAGLARFWARRWLRTLPLYYLFLAFHIATTWGEPGHAAYGPYFLFLQSFHAASPGFFPVSWSLVLEEWFYLLAPLGGCVVLALAGAADQRADLRRLLWTVCAAGMVALAARSWMSLRDPAFTWTAARKSVFAHSDVFCVGVAVALVRQRFPSAFAAMAGRRSASLGLLGVLGIAAFYESCGSDAVLDQSLFARGPLFLVFALACVGPMLFAERRWVAGGAFVRWVSRHTYALYLSHLLFMAPLAGWAAQRGTWWAGLAGLGAALALSAALSAALYSGLERPILRWRDRALEGGGGDRLPPFAEGRAEG